MDIKLMITMFFEFFKIGLFAVGGGPATLPYLMELTQKYDWFTMEDLTNMVAVSESTPGPLGLNMATYTGVHAMGVFGGIVTTMGLVLPSIVIICIIAAYFAKMNENRYVQAAFKGIRPAVTAVIASAIVGICRVSLFIHTEQGLVPAWKSIVLCVIVLGLLQIKKLKKFHPVWWFVIGGILGVILKF